MGAEEKFSRIKRGFKQRSYVRVIEDCNAYLRQYKTKDNYDVCVCLAHSHFELNQFAQGVAALEDAQNIAQAEGNLEGHAYCASLVKQQWARVIAQAHSGLITNLDRTINSESMRDKLREPTYIMSLERLKKEHEKKPADFYSQVEHINKLMHFFFTTYGHRKGYIRAQYLDENPEVKTARLKIADKMLLSGLKSNHSILYKCDTLLEVGKKEIDELCTDIYLDDAQLVLRMIFKAIHSLPRDKCNALVHLLPWGSNSWYFLHFIGSLMESYGEQFFNTLFILSMPSDTDEQNKVADNYLTSLRFSNCTLKATLLDQDVWKDLQKLRTLFSALQENLKTNNNNLQPEHLSKIDELPTLKKLVWYFKHLHNLYRLQGVLPEDNHQGTVLSKKDAERLDTRRNPMTLLLKMDWMGSKPKAGDLKSHLAFLRRLQLVGELFTRKNWGFFLNTMDYFDPQTVINIRNALVHIEQLTSSEALLRLERDTARLGALHTELSHLKSYLRDVVLKERKAHFKEFPREDKLTSLRFWLSDMTQYWESVKKYYEQQFKESKFEEDATPLYKENFIPRVPLLNPGILSGRLENRLKSTLGMNESDNTDFNVYIRFLRKVFDAHKSLLTELELAFQGNKVLDNDYLLGRVINTLAQRDHNLPIVKALLEAAEARSTELRREKRESFEERRAQFERELTRKEEVRQNLIKTKMTSSYPCIIQSAAEFANAFNEAQQPSVSELVNRLKNRISLLQLLFKENGTPIALERQDITALQGHLAVDVSLYFATSYLVGQIVSLFNKLHSLGELKEIHPDLSRLLEEYVGLRNAMEHSDPFMDSEKGHQTLMENSLPDAMAYMISEIAVRYGEQILSHVPKAVPVLAVPAIAAPVPVAPAAAGAIPAAAAPEVDAGKIRQSKAVDIKQFISSCDKRLNEYRMTTAYVRPSTAGFFAASAASSRSLLRSSAARALTVPDIDSELVVLSPQFSSSAEKN